MKYKIPYFEELRGDDGLFHFVYKITNLINNKFYIGVHNTADLGDGYKGSGNILRKAFQKYGKKNFVREILSFHKTEKDAYEEEKRIVNEKLLNNENCYNVSIGGKGNSVGMCPVRNIKTGECRMMNTHDSLYGKEYISVNKGSIPVLNKISNKYERISRDDFNPSIHEGIHKGKIVLYNTESKCFEQVNVDDPRRKTGILISASKNKVTVVDENGTWIQVDKNHPDYLSGKLKTASKNKWTIRNKITKKCISVPINSNVDWDIFEFATCRIKKSDNPKLKKGRIIGEKHYKWYNYDDPRFETMDILEYKPRGERNIYVTNFNKTIDIAISKDELEKFLEYHEGWKLGHKIYKSNKPRGTTGRVWVNNGVKNKLVFKNEVENFLFLHRNWKRGCLMNKKHD